MTSGQALGKIELVPSLFANQQQVAKGRKGKLQELGRQSITTLYMLIRNVRMYESSLMFDDDEPIGRPWEEIRWYSGNEEIKEVPKPDIPEIQPPKPRK